MIKITIEGPRGAGKSRIGSAIKHYCSEQGWTVMCQQESTPAAIAKYKPHVLIDEKVNRDANV